jgi:hypothetical protein
MEQTIGLKAVLGVCLLWPALAAGQLTTAQISGHARDATGAVVPNVRVTVASAGIGVTRTTLTNESGYYIVTNLPVGVYEVTGQVPGFKKFVKSGIVLNAGAAISVDIELAVGEATERVEVTATLQTIATDTSQVGRLVGRDQLLELPVGGRSFINLIGAQAGVSHTGNFNDFVFSPYFVGSWTVNGSRSYQNLWQIDGVVNVRTRANNFLTGTMSIDAVQEVQIVTAGFKAEHGRNSGSQINFITKSGTQEFHGSAYWYGRNDKLDAKEFFALTKQHLRWNNWGWTLGGPIYIPGKWNTDKSRMFFFFNQEWNKRRAGSSTVGWVPPLELREGNFNTPYRPAALAIPVDPLNKQPFPGNIIPKTRFSRNGYAFTKVIPEPTFAGMYTGNNLIRQLLARNDVRIHTFKVDYNYRSTRITVRGNQTDTWDYSPQNFAVPASQDFDRPKKNGTVQVTTTLSPTAINEFLFGATVDVNKIMPSGKGFDRRTYGIDFPYVFPMEQKLLPYKLPNVSVSGVGSFTGGPYPSKSTGPIYQWRNHFTKVVANHTFKFGAYVEAAQQNDMDSVLVGASGLNQNGVFWFTASKANPLTTGNAWADMLLGNFDSYEEIGLRAYIPWRSRAYEGFAQDSWKVNRELTLEYGLRWSYMPPFHSAWGNIQSFNPKYYDPKQAVTVQADGTIVPGSGFLYNGITLPGNDWPKGAIGRVPFASDPDSKRLFHGLPKTLTDTHHLWGPRFGFAWDIAGRHQTVVRGGFGIFYDRITCNDWSHPGGVSPLQPVISINNGQVDNPGGTAALRRIFPIPGSMIDPVSKNPASYQWSFGIQRQLMPNLTMDAAYVGRQDRHLFGGVNYNHPPLGATYANPGKALDSLRPYAGFSYIRFTENAYNGNYNALQVTVTRRYASGLHYSVAYTWSKAMNESEGLGDMALNKYDTRQGRYGRASYHRQQMLNISYIYELPFLRQQRGVLGKIAGGWQVSGLTMFQSGMPTGIGVPGDLSGTGQGARPNWVSNPNLPKERRTLTRYFDTSAVVAPAPATWGNLGRNVLVRPGINNWDLAFSKNFRLRESLRLQFRAEMFNAFNHPQFTGLSTTLGAGNFGYVTGARAQRMMQYGLRADF